ncbi:creatininase family protein [Labrys wisconsinensis]|uniref:Creatinine amidohydrolase n=1 Tax=Labrys wisconsinensis TaxID=425677 RepID=A0ABU0JA79_9HYPH|nr:creatininase family protein [Labrys wisconsinensis]MDQ0471175.1 creatinine amidohydrolase [Labrys wisconsinensis]
MPLPRRHWFEMTTEDFRAGDAASWIAVLPIAAVEQHGPHLPVGVDSMIMQGYLDRVIPLVPEEIPATFLPIQTIGKSNEHLAFPGTLTISAETAIRAWVEIGESVHRAGVRKLLIVNSHGGNMAVMDVVARELRVRHGMLAAFTSWHMFGYPDGLFPADETRLGIHAGEIETALMLEFRPDTVKTQEARDFRPVTYEMEQTFRHLRTGRPAGFGWMAQDLHAAGAAGDAGKATREAGAAAADFGAAAFIELLADIHSFELARLETGPLG